MQFSILLSALLVLASGTQTNAALKTTCSLKVIDLCQLLKTSPATTTKLAECNVKYPYLNDIKGELSELANLYIRRSYDYLMLATQFGAHIRNRLGFEKLFRGLSDRSYEDGIAIMNHLTKHGGVVAFDSNSETLAYTINDELGGMGLALDIEKSLAEKAYKVHKVASHLHKNTEDATNITHQHHHHPEIAHFIEEKLLGKQADTIRELAGHMTNLKAFVKSNTPTAMYIFDEYLLKQ